MTSLPDHTDFTVLNSFSPALPEREPLTPAQARRRGELIQSLHDLVIVPEDAHTMEYWQLGVYGAFKPRNAWEDWAGQQASVMMFRISRSERIERRLRDLQSLRAIEFWEDDQRLKVEEVASRLAAEPGPTYAKLRSTPAGCDWLIARWQVLAEVPADQWTEAQKLFVRQVCPVRASQTLTPGFAQNYLIRLQEERERNRDADRALRALVEADISDEVSQPLARIRRYRASLQRELKWYIAQLRIEPPQRRLDHRFHPDYDRQMIEPYPPTPNASASLPEAGPVAVIAADQTNPTADAPIGRISANDQTNPTADASACSTTANDQTNPTADASACSTTSDDQANPTAAERNEAKPPEVVEQIQVPTPRQIAAPAPIPDRKRRPDPQRELARRRRAARRRSG